jgi:hypothetical protein
MLRLLRMLGVLVVIFGVSIVLVRAATSTRGQTSLTALFKVGRCVYPCWNGIVPSVTTLQQVKTIMKPVQDKYPPATGRAYTGRDRVCWSFSAFPGWIGCAIAYQVDGEISLLEFRPPKNSFTVGEAMMVFGEPLLTEQCGGGGYGTRPFSVINSPGMETVFMFRKGVFMSAYGFEHKPSFLLDPSMPIHSVRYYRNNRELPADAKDWRGFSWQSIHPTYCGEG